MSDYTRILALDVGERRIGVAVSDPLGITAQSVDTIVRTSDKADIAAIEALLKSYSTDRVLVGLPGNLKGEEGVQAEYTRAFASKLSARGWQVRFYDERMTTALARNTLIESGMRREKRKQYIDRVAATFILQSFMDAGGWKKRLKGNEVFRMNEDINNTYDENMDDESTIVELTDQDGNNVKFELVMTVEHEGENYLILAPAEEIEGIDDDEAVILHVERDENGEDMYVSIEDEDLLEAVFNKYLELAEAEDDGEDE